MHRIGSWLTFNYFVADGWNPTVQIIHSLSYLFSANFKIILFQEKVSF